MVTEEELNELLEEKRIEKQTIALTANYHKSPSLPDINQIILKHKKGIERLEALKIDPQIEKLKEEKLKAAVYRHMKAQETINQVVNARFSQDDLNRSKSKGAV